MKCPNCSTDITDERQLSVVDDASGEAIAWYKLAPRKKIACPGCGIALKHQFSTLLIAGLAGLGLVVVMSLNLLFPDNPVFPVIYPILVIAVIVCVRLLMLSKRNFQRDD